MDGKILRRAAELVEQGHCKNFLAATGDGLGLFDPLLPQAERWCMGGAIIKATAEITGETDYISACDVWKRHMTFKLVYWNNAPERTSDEVAHGLRKLAAIWESRDG